MIHVVSCHHFVSQEVFQSEQAPLAYCSSQGKILIATDENNIQIHDLDSRGKIVHSFASIDQVDQIIYSNAGNYVATLEKKLTKLPKPVTYVRIYFNWWMDSSGQPINVRVAGTPTALISDIWHNHFEMIELPLTTSALCISCCKTTAALAVSLGKTISVFTYDAGSSNHQWHNFSHFFDIDISFMVLELEMCKNYFACMSSYHVQVFKVFIEKEETSETTQPDNDVAMSTPDNDNLDEHFVEWRFESCDDSGWENEMKKRLHPNSFPIGINLPLIDKENANSSILLQNYEILGPVLTVKGNQVKVRLDSSVFEVWPSLSSTNIDAITLLYREFAFDDAEAKLMSLNLVSFYNSDNYDRTLDPLHAAAAASQENFSSLPWTTSNLEAHPPLKAIGCFFSTSREGFFYDVTENAKLVGTYTYTSTLRSVAVDSMFLHALTDAGLETYTLHLSHCAFEHVENLDKVKNVCPDYDSPICLLGLRPFLGATKLVMSEDHLIVVSTLDEVDQISDSLEEGRNATLYILKKPSPQLVFSDLLETAQMYRASSPSTYLLILKEGHMILRTHLYLKGNYDSDTEALYLKSCILLGDYYTCCTNPAEKYLAAPYYHMSKLPLDEVIEQVLGFQNQFKHSNVLKSLVIFLRYELIDRRHPDASKIPKVISEHILDAFLEKEPEYLWKIILCSGLVTFRIDKAILMLKRQITNKRHQQNNSSIVGDTLAIVSLLLQKGNMDAAQNMYFSISKIDLVAMLTDNYQLLWTAAGLTALGKFTQQTRPESFVEILLRVTKAKHIKVHDVIDMLQTQYSNLEVHKVPQLKEYLEAVWNDNHLQLEMTTSSQVLLVNIYLKRLIERPATMTKFSSLLGVRPQWLNETSPFCGKSPSRNCTHRDNDAKKEELQDSPCTCISCNESLLQLQCFLVHQNVTTELRERILDFLSTVSDQEIGRTSLEVLCLSSERAAVKLLDYCPSALFQFACDMFRNDQEKWCKMFHALLHKMDDIAEDDPNVAVYSQTFHQTLSHLSELLSVSDFIALLPSDKEEDVFTPYVKRCCEKHQSRQLKIKIVALGNEIKAMM